MGLLVAAAVHFAKSPEIPRLHYWLLLTLGAMSFFMMFRLSRPLWELAPELRFVQFPWRHAVPFAVAFAFFLGAIAGKSRRLAIVAVCLFVFSGPIAKILLAVARPASWKKAEISQLQASIDGGMGYRGTPEYLPNGANLEALENAGIRSGTASQGSSEFSMTDEVDRETFRVQFEEPREIALNLFDYPTWQVVVDGSRINPKRTDRDGRILVDIPAGNHSVHVFPQRKWDAKLGIAISIATAVLLSCLSFMAWRQNDRPTRPENRV
jgi:HAMP domain-containing protein